MIIIDYEAGLRGICYGFATKNSADRIPWLAFNCGFGPEIVWFDRNGPLLFDVLQMC